jgi:hypothetical protein
MKTRQDDLNFLEAKRDSAPSGEAKRYRAALLEAVNEMQKDPYLELMRRELIEILKRENITPNDPILWARKQELGAKRSSYAESPAFKGRIAAKMEKISRAAAVTYLAKG